MQGMNAYAQLHTKADAGCCGRTKHVDRSKGCLHGSSILSSIHVRVAFPTPTGTSAKMTSKRNIALVIMIHPVAIIAILITASVHLMQVPQHRRNVLLCAITHFVAMQRNLKQENLDGILMLGSSAETR
jgi:hypothetical protein